MKIAFYFDYFYAMLIGLALVSFALFMTSVKPAEGRDDQALGSLLALLFFLFAIGFYSGSVYHGVAK